MMHRALSDANFVTKFKMEDSEETACSTSRLQTQKHLTNKFGRIPTETNKLIQDFSRAHIESFNYVLSEGLVRAIQDIPPTEFSMPNGEKIFFAFRDAAIAIPSVADNIHSSDLRLYPSECRLRGISYSGKLHVKLTWSISGRVMPSLEKCVGELPIMVKSKGCALNDMSPKELVAHGEEAQEFGGYFIVNGNEKLIRMLINPRRNYPMAMTRQNWRSRGKLFSIYGVSIRCVKADQFSTNMVLHYLTNGTAKLMFAYMREIYFVPVVLLIKALCDYSDREIYAELTKGKEDDSYYRGCIATMLRQVQDEKLLNRKQILKYIGERFRAKVKLADWYTDEQVADFLLKQCICVHLDSNLDKVHLLIFMTKKLFAAVNGQCALESPDNPMNQEVMLGGHLYLNILKEKLAYWLSNLKLVIERKTKTGKLLSLTKADVISAMRHCSDVTRAMEYFLATGNLVSNSGLGMRSYSGFTVIAEKLNYLRYVAHFRCVHRGTFLAQLRTTEARKLLPESWGFICPVHTPDGAPCGLLNHLAAKCEIVAYQPQVSYLPKLLCSYGMTPLNSPPSAPFDQCYTVMLDGRILGYVAEELAASLVSKLCLMKISNDKVPSHLEICLVPFTGKPSQYPGLYLFSTPCRMIRPVLNLATRKTEFIGSFEQVYLNIAVTADEIYPEMTTHLELQQTNMLSFAANLIPLSNFNQSPRNMYQCQMAKQTMGTPAMALRNRTDNKLYRILTPQSPLFRPVAYDQHNMDDYPLGTNAIVAVISYTGYDMEDAMILNKGSFERGFAHGIIYKNEYIDLAKRQRTVTKYFGRPSDADDTLKERIGPDGMPHVGTLLQNNDPFYCTIDVTTGQSETVRYKAFESAFVEDVLLLGSSLGKGELQKVCIRLRIPRNPTIGDKFASRHGQKGICSHKWPQENMPFTESGMTPDILFNPHGFPSRMTIGMMIESMAGKSAASHGLVHDASPFQFSENDSAIEYFGKMLEAAGYNYYGTERMYGGVDGRELNADIFFGVVYYQRLRHMVADKFQVRATGPIDSMTKQPIQGRKRGGGIRFGEMERDSLLAHGVSCLLQDRLFNCSDRSLEYVCVQCGGLLSPILRIPKTTSTQDARRVWTCSVCGTGDHVELISLPFVFRYMAAELASVNIKVVLNVVDPQRQDGDWPDK